MFISLIRILTFPGAKTHLCCNVGLHDRLHFTRGVYLSSVEHFPVIILQTVVMFTASRERSTLASIAPQPQQQQQWQIGHFHCYSLHISRVELTQTRYTVRLQCHCSHSVIRVALAGDCSCLVNIIVTWAEVTLRRYDMLRHSVL